MQILSPLAVERNYNRRVNAEPVVRQRVERGGMEWVAETLAWVHVGETLRLKHDGPLFRVLAIDELLGEATLEPTLGGRPVTLTWNRDNGKNRHVFVWRPAESKGA